MDAEQIERARKFVTSQSLVQRAMRRDVGTEECERFLLDALRDQISLRGGVPVGDGQVEWAIHGDLRDAWCWLATVRQEFA